MEPTVKIWHEARAAGRQIFLWNIWEPWLLWKYCTWEYDLSVPWPLIAPFNPPNALLCHQLLEPLHHFLRTDPRDRDRLELSGHGFVGLRDQPVHGEVSSRESHVPRPEGERRAEVVGSITHVVDPLVRTAPLVRSAVHIVPDYHLFAHVVGAPGAFVGMEGPHHQPAVFVEGGRVSENPVEELADPGVSEPGLNEEGVGVRHQHHLKVLLRPGAEELEEGEHAGGGRELLHNAAYVALGDALLR